MASDQSAAAAGSQPTAQVVGNAFVQQFYHILHQSPELVYRFYHESSKLGRARPDGEMESVTTMQAINEKILAMGYNDFRAEIKTVDAQESLDGGVIVLVTGYLTGKDLVKKDFTQSFFLAPQDKGYFVLNDIFRYVDEDDHQLGNAELSNGTATPLSSEQDATTTQEQAAQEQTPPPTLEEEEEDVEEDEEEEEEEEEEENGEEVYNPPEKEKDPATVEEEAPVEEVIDEVPSGPPAVIPEATSVTTVHERKSYASIVRYMKENPAPLSVPTPAPARQAPATQERHSTPAPLPAQVPELPADTSNGTENSNTQEAEADGYSIYVRSLPLSATPAQLEEEFKKFGPIKPGGIQVRSNKIQGFCFGFVQFEVASAVQSAIEASPVMIGGRQAFVEEKRPTTTRVSNRGRFTPGRGAGFRGDGARGRGSYGGGRGFGRGDYNNRAEFGNRGGGRGGSSNRGGDVYQRVDSGRGSRSGSLTGNSSPKSVAPLVPEPA